MAATTVGADLVYFDGTVFPVEIPFNRSHVPAPQVIVHRTHYFTIAGAYYAAVPPSTRLIYKEVPTPYEVT